MIVARGGNATLHIAGEEQFDVPQLIVFHQHPGAAFFQFARNFRRVPFHREIQIAERSSGNQVAYRSAGQINVEAHRGGKFLHAREYRALFRREPALQQKHIIGHCAPSSLFRVFAEQPR